MSKRAGHKSNIKRLWKWLDSYELVSSAIEEHGDLVELLEAGGGICKIENFLPEFAAEGILEVLEQCEESDWNVTAAGDDYAQNNISHDFLSSKSSTLEAVFRVFTLLLPESLFTFSAAKYCRAGHIKPHDDRAYTQVCMEDGSIQLCSRNIAVIYYLTKGWSAADGGALIDHEAPGGPQTHIPTFNSVISFTIPRWHEVTPVVGNRPRYSIFGWFLEPGKLYDLQLDPQLPSRQELDQQQQRKQQQQEQQLRKQRKQKHKKQLKHGAAVKQSNTKRAKQQELLTVQPLQGVSKAKRRKKNTQQSALPLEQEQQQQQQQQAGQPRSGQQAAGLEQLSEAKGLCAGVGSGSNQGTPAGSRVANAQKKQHKLHSSPNGHGSKPHSKQHIRR